MEEDLEKFLIELKYQANRLDLLKESDVCICMSSITANKIVNAYLDILLDTPVNIGVSTFKLFGYDVYPSDFLKEYNFFVGFKR